jgi:hypothetical protein
MCISWCLLNIETVCSDTLQSVCIGNRNEMLRNRHGRLTVHAQCVPLKGNMTVDTLASYMTYFYAQSIEIRNIL